MKRKAITTSKKRADAMFRAQVRDLEQAARARETQAVARVRAEFTRYARPDQNGGVVIGSRPESYDFRVMLEAGDPLRLFDPRSAEEANRRQYMLHRLQRDYLLATFRAVPKCWLDEATQTRVFWWDWEFVGVSP